MTTIQISKTYNIEWRLSGKEHYGVTKDGILINCQTGKILKRTVVGYSKGYYIEGKFTTLTKLRAMMVTDKKAFCPF